MKKLSFPLIFVLLLVSCMFFPFTACGEKEYTMEDCFEVIQYDPENNGVITLSDLMSPTVTKKNSKFYTDDAHNHTRDVIIFNANINFDEYVVFVTRVSFYDQVRQKEVDIGGNDGDEYSILAGEWTNGKILNIGKYGYIQGLHNLKIDFYTVKKTK